MLRLISGGLLALALAGCASTSASTPAPTIDDHAVFDVNQIVDLTPPTTTPCVMVVPEHWLCPKGVQPPPN